MRKVVLTVLTLCLCAVAAPAQKGRDFADYWVGIVVASDMERRELRLRSADEKKPGSFDGVFEPQFVVSRRDGSSEKTERAELPVGERVRVYYKMKDETVGGKKTKVSRIYRVAFLGPDDFTILRSRLRLSDSAPVTPVKSKTLPAAEPLKLYAVFDHGSLRDDFDVWLGRWQKEQAAKYGEVELVNTLEQADAALVVHKGTTPGALRDAVSAGMASNLIGEDVEVVTGYLLVPGGGGFDIVWQERFYVSPDASPKGRFHAEVEKRFKARRGK